MPKTSSGAKTAVSEAGALLLTTTSQVVRAPVQGHAAAWPKDGDDWACR